MADVDALCALGEALLARSEVLGALRALEEAAALAAAHPYQQIRILHRLGTVYLDHTLNVHLAQDALERAQALLPHAPDLELPVRTRLLEAAGRLGNVAAVRRVAAAAQQHALQHRDQGWVVHIASLAARHVPDPVSVFEQPLAEAGLSDDTRGRLLALRGHAHAQAGSLAAARADLEAAYGLCPAVHLYAQVVLALLAVQACEPSRAAAAIERARGHLDTAPAPWLPERQTAALLLEVLTIMTNKAMQCSLRDQRAAANRTLAKLAALDDSPFVRLLQALLSETVVHIYLALGDVPLAREALPALGKVAGFEAAAHFAHAQILIAEEAYDKARTALADALAAAGAHQSVLALCCQCLLCIMDLCTGQAADWVAVAKTLDSLEPTTDHAAMLVHCTRALLSQRESRPDLSAAEEAFKLGRALGNHHFMTRLLLVMHDLLVEGSAGDRASKFLFTAYRHADAASDSEALIETLSRLQARAARKGDDAKAAEYGDELAWRRKGQAARQTVN